MIKEYYELTKPGIVYGNALVAAAGFAYASTNFSWPGFFAMLIGLSCIIASACVCNNYFDRNIDAKMARTKHRALVQKTIFPQNAFLFAATLGFFGVAVLYMFSTPTALLVAVAGWLVYVLAYTPLKHITPHALWVGAIAGATPPVVGYAAVTNSLDMNAFWLFLFLCLWQVPHFLGIAAFRYDEYQEAGIALLIAKPSARGKRIGRIVFYASLVVLLLWCGALMLHK